jgi:hypothetical protein
LSNIVSIKTEVKDAEAVQAACKRLGLQEPIQGTARLFEGGGDRACSSSSQDGSTPP